jgi:hydroxymethylbilane synthase
MPPANDSGKWRMVAQVVAPDGEAMVQVDTEAPCDTDPIALGQRVAADLKSQGALDLLSATAV